MKKLIAFAAPILPGKTENWRNFISEISTTYKKEFLESRKTLGVTERTFLQTTPNGDFVIVTLEGENPETAMERFGKSTDTFSNWFINQVKDIHGFDLSEEMELPELMINTETEKFWKNTPATV